MKERLRFDYNSFHTPDPDMQDWDPIVDSSGTLLYENGWGSLLRQIIMDNDVTTLKHYIAKHLKHIFWSGECGDSDDTIYVAASSGSVDVMRVMIDHYHTNPDFHDNPTLRKYYQPPNFSAVEVACSSGCVDMVKYLLDDDPLRGTVYAKEYHSGMALLAAAHSLVLLTWSGANERDWLREHIEQSETLINMLLDRGASVRDAIRFYRRNEDEDSNQVIETVLGHAITRASAKLIPRLIAEGADVHARQWWGDYTALYDAEQATALHIGSLYWNLEGIQVLLHNHGEIDHAEMVSARDSRGRLPIHWAAGGFEDSYSGHVCAGEDSTRCIDILKLLLESNPNTINVQDEEGKTALFYVLDHALFRGTCRYVEEVIRFLCEHGADAGIKDQKGQSVLYHIGTMGRIVGCSPISRAILDILVAHGGRINDADEEGDTALHILTRLQGKWLRRTRQNQEIHTKQMEMYNTMVKYLQEIGGSMDQRNKAGETPQELLNDGYRNEGAEKPAPKA